MATNKHAQDGKKTESSSSTSEFPPCGYPVYDMDKEMGKWKCVFCSYIIKEPIQFIECGDRCCRGCYESRVASSSTSKIVCPAKECNYEFDRSQTMFDRAFKRELDAKKVTCVHKDGPSNCSWSGTLNIYQEHLDTTHTHFVCDKCQETFSTTQALQDHHEKSCSSLFEKCPFGSYCTNEMIRKDDFAGHLLSEKHQEATALMLIRKFNSPELSDQEQDMEITTGNTELEQETSEKISELAEKVQKITDETVKLSRDYIKLSELSQVAHQEVEYFQTACTERNNVMSNLQPKQDEIQQEIERIKKNLEENQHTSTDGTLTWRVDRVADRMADAQSERTPSIFSPIFYSKPYGYKMRARLYLHGDGNARRTHMSLFFVLMKGEFDPLLTWPFAHKVTFCLFDQTGTNRHIIDSFRPDIKSSSFQRPVSESNIASGIPKFFPLPMIQQDDNPYVREDTLFLKIMIDLHDTPKVVLPYVLSLNPGLPTHVQEFLINQEKIKREQQTTTGT